MSASAKKKPRHLRGLPKVTVPVRATLREDLEASLDEVRAGLRAAVGDLSMLIHDTKLDIVIDGEDLGPIRDALAASLSAAKCLGWQIEEVPVALAEEPIQ